MSKKIVCFGGKNVIPRIIIAPLKKYPVKITAITSMVDNGGSTGQLRKDFGVLPPGDIRRHILGLSDAPKWKKELWEFRFGQEVFPGGHKGHNFANVFLAGLEYALKDYEKVLAIARQFMEVKRGHRALPATLNNIQLLAVLENGKTIFGEDEIDVPKIHDGKLKIKKIYLKPKAKVYPPVLDSIKKADLLIFGPGDFYSSIIPCFLPKGIPQAIQKTKAKKVFVCNLMTKFGETNNFTVSDFVKETERYIGCQLDLVIYNNFIPEKRRIKKYKKNNPNLLDLVKVDPSVNSEQAKKKFRGSNLLLKKGPVEHDPKKLAKFLFSLM